VTWIRDQLLVIAPDQLHVRYGDDCVEKLGFWSLRKM
jgi:hypothetical protein